MHNILDILQRFHHFLLFIVFEILAVLLLFSNDGYHRSVYFSSANTVIGGVYSVDSYIRHFFSLSEINEQLTQRNVQLEARISQLSKELTEKTGDSTYVSEMQKEVLAGIKTIPAKVVSNSLSQLDNYITLDKGSSDGVKIDMGVVAGTGVVGIVREVGPHYSLVIPVLNSKSSISCMIEKRGYFGYLHWTGGDTRLAYVDDVPRHARFKLYERVVTSGYSAVFPPGLPIGKILHVYNSSDGISYRMQVELAVNFSRLRDVCIIDNSDMQERLELMKVTKDSLDKK